ncbi:MAG: hypothetical protein ACLVKO_07760 [Dysgonomonas sp.]
MKDTKKHILFCFLAVMLSVTVQAQKASVRATIQPPEILIGEQAVINLEVVTPKGDNILFPVFKDTLVSGIEVLHMLPADTTIAHEVMTINQKYVVTSFDSALYHVPYIPVVANNDTIKSNDFGLKVSSLPLSPQVLSYLDQMKTGQTDSIDFEQLQLADIKPIQEVPFVWQDYLAYLWIVLLILLILILIGLGLYFVLRKKNKGYFFKPEVVLPPHVVAIKALDKIKAEKAWQHGQEKKFYTELTDVLREYIEKRFLINSFEKTSDEIISSLKMQLETDTPLENLQQILKLSDLVKFAKYKPLPNENDLTLVNAYLFVNQTKIEPPVNENDGENNNGKENEIKPEQPTDSVTTESEAAKS